MAAVVIPAEITPAGVILALARIVKYGPMLISKVELISSGCDGVGEGSC
jgi:hypothetical protein